MNQLINKLIPLFVLVALFFIWQKSGVKLSPHYKAGDVPQGMCPKDKGGVKLTSSLSTTWLCDGPSGETGHTGASPTVVPCDETTNKCCANVNYQGVRITDANGNGAYNDVCYGEGGKVGPAPVFTNTCDAACMTACSQRGGLTCGPPSCETPVYLCAGASGTAGLDIEAMWSELETNAYSPTAIRNIGSTAAADTVKFTGGLTGNASGTASGLSKNLSSKNIDWDNSINLGDNQVLAQAFITSKNGKDAGNRDESQGIYRQDGVGGPGSGSNLVINWGNDQTEGGVGRYSYGNQNTGTPGGTGPGIHTTNMPIYLDSQGMFWDSVNATSINGTGGMAANGMTMYGQLNMNNNLIENATTIGASGNISGKSLITNGGTLVGLNTLAGEEIFIDWTQCSSKGLGYIQADKDPKCF